MGLLLRTLLGACLLLTPPALPVLQAQEVKVAFWNVQWFPGTKPNATAKEQQRQIELVLPAIEKMNPDIIGLMEIRDPVAAKVAVSRIPDMKVDVCSDFQEPGQPAKSPHQIALASRFPAIGAWSEAPSGRGFSFAAYQPRPGNVLLVYVLHLRSNRGALHEDISVREESITQFLTHQREMEKAYASMGKVTIVVGGDFNTSADDPRFRHETTLRKLVANDFQWGWANVPLSARLTLQAFGPHPAICFDHVFVRGGAISSAAVVEGPPGASDHRAVVASIALPEPDVISAPLAGTPEPAPAAAAPTVEAVPDASPMPENPAANASPEASPALGSEANSL